MKWNEQLDNLSLDELNEKDYIETDHTTIGDWQVAVLRISAEDENSGKVFILRAD